MGYKESILAFLMKKDFDFNRADIDLYNFHPQILAILAIQGIFFGKRDSLLRFVNPVISITITIVGLILQGLCVYRGLTISDLSLACECFCYTLMLGSVIAVYIGVLSNQKKIITLVEDMNEDFKAVCSIGPRYRKPFLKGQLLVWILCFAWAWFVCGTALMFISYPCLVLMYQSLIATQDEHMIRPLAFPLWLPHDDPYRTPNYEMFLVLETVYCVIFVLGFAGYVYTLFHFLLHYYIMLDMIIQDISVIFDGLDESVGKLPRNHPSRVAVQLIINKRLKRIVNWHLSVFKAITTISAMFRPCIVYQLMFSSMTICLIAYQITHELENGTIDVLFIMLAAAASLQLWIPCYLGTLIRNKGFAIADACWNCGWHEKPLGPMVHNDLLIIIMRAQKPIYIKYTGQPGIELETFSAIMSKAYSYFNMIRQSDIGK